MYLNPMLTRENYSRIPVYIGHWANITFFPIFFGKEQTLSYTCTGCNCGTHSSSSGQYDLVWQNFCLSTIELCRLTIADMS